MNLCRRRPIVFAFRLVEQHCAVIILQLEGVFVLWIRQKQAGATRPAQAKDRHSPEDRLLPVQNAQRGMLHRMIDIQPDQQRIVLAAEMNDAVEIRP